jgi:hypothetical protein
VIFSFEAVPDAGFKHTPLFRGGDRSSIWDHAIIKRQVQAALERNGFDPSVDKWVVGWDNSTELIALNALLTRYSGVNVMLYDVVSDTWKERTFG